ncbi:MAG: 4-hydroxy-tetrahydrodipicolinate synthase [Chloroflexi bacterium]|nr:4-hydroxy-tetrahydrodipicolinate synthase [Chloroflexota bacterium]
MVELGRVLTAMVTPFDDGGAVDWGQVRALATALVASGSNGLVVSGTTGESPTLSVEEKLRLFAEVKGAIGGRGAVVAGTGNYNTHESIELTREAERAGADGILLVVPYYNKPPQEGLYQHFRAIAASTHLPCILYNVPSRTVANLAAETAIRLSEIENIVGVKEASSNLDQITKIAAGVRPGFRIWSGNDSETLPILAVGGYGIVSVAGHLVGRQIQQMIQHHLAGQPAAAAAIHQRLLPLINALFLVANPIPLKYALNRVGFRVGKPRLPLVEPDEKTARQIDAALAGSQIDLTIPSRPGA